MRTLKAVHGAYSVAKNVSRSTDVCAHRAMIASTVAENVSTAPPIESVNLSRKRPMIARKPADDCERLQLGLQPLWSRAERTVSSEGE